MTPDRWQRIKDLLNDALQSPVDERPRRLEQACAGDEALRQEVESLLRWASDDTSFLEPNADGRGILPEDSTLDPFLIPGTTEIGPYRVEQEIGRGGMGRVFLAHDQRLHRKVAIKVLKEKSASSGNEGALILREARAIARLSHPHIASVHDVVEQGGRTYIVMEFLEGETLAERLSRGRLPPEEVVQLSAQMAAGLAHAHRQSIVHCDFKPANVFITRDGIAKILDFGLARVVAGETSRESAHLGASPTQIRLRAGTPAYMSPEHLNGEPLDARSDVYSFGIVLHEMATGRRPSLALPQGAPGASDLLDPSLSSDLRAIAARAVAPDPAQRFSSAVELEAALRDVAQSHSPWSMFSVREALAAAALIAVLVGAATYWITNRRNTPIAETQAARAVVAVLPFATPSGDSTARYLAAGLTEIVTNDLSTSKDLVVVSNNSVRSLAAGDPDPAVAAMELGATHVIIGTLRSDGPRLSAEVRVFSAQSKSFSPVTKVEVTVSEVVANPRTMAGLIRARLSGVGLPVSVQSPVATSTTSDPLALEEYARGREYLYHFDAGENLDIALTLFESALHRDPRFALVHAAMSEAGWRKYRRTRDATWAARAEASAFEALRLAPNEPAVRYSAAMVLQGTGRTREAIDEAQRVIELQPTGDEAHRLLAQLYAESGDIDKAIPEFHAAIELRPGWWENYHAMGVANFDKGRYQDAIAAFTRETELRPDSATPFQALGTSYHAIGDVTHALENYERAIAIAPSAFSYSNIGLIHYSRGLFREAVAAYEQSAKISPREPVTYRNLGDSLQKAGDTERARTSYRQAIALAADQLRINPNRARMWTLQAVCYAKLHESAAARKAITAALAIVPAENGALFQAGVASALIGNADGAMALLTQAVAAGYGRQLVAEDEDLESLRSRPDFKALLVTDSKN